MNSIDIHDSNEISQVSSTKDDEEHPQLRPSKVQRYKGHRDGDYPDSPEGEVAAPLSSEYSDYDEAYKRRPNTAGARKWFPG